MMIMKYKMLINLIAHCVTVVLDGCGVVPLSV